MGQNVPMKIASATRRALVLLAQEMSAPAIESDPAEWVKGFRSGRLLGDPGRWLSLTGSTYEIYQDALDRLAAERALSSYGREALDAHLWSFGISLDGLSGPLTDGQASAAVGTFLRQIDVDAIEWSVLLELEGISELDGTLSALRLTILPPDEQSLSKTGCRRRTHGATPKT